MMAILVCWVYDVLEYLGLYKKPARILLLGLTNSGKTTLLHVLIHGRLAVHCPTYYPTSDDLQLGGMSVQAFDMGGDDIARRVWKDYHAVCDRSAVPWLKGLLRRVWRVCYAQVDAVVYLVDAADRGRFEETKRQLDALLADDGLAAAPFLILGNKVDIPTAAGEDELRQRLDLTCSTGKRQVALPDAHARPLEVFMCSLATHAGYSEGICWAIEHIKRARRPGRSTRGSGST